MLRAAVARWPPFAASAPTPTRNLIRQNDALEPDPADHPDRHDNFELQREHSHRAPVYVAQARLDPS